MLINSEFIKPNGFYMFNLNYLLIKVDEYFGLQSFNIAYKVCFSIL